MSIKINFETPLEFFAQSGFWRIDQNVRFAFLVHLYNSEVSDADLVSKTNPVVTKKLNFENLENQSELHLLDIPHCRNFDARMKKMIFHTWLAPQTRKFQLKFCSGNVNLQSVFMDTYAFKYRVKTCLKHILVFSHDQDFVGSIKIFHFSLLFSYKTRWFPLKTLLEKKQTCGHREAWLWEARWVNLIAVSGHFALSDFQCRDQELYFAMPSYAISEKFSLQIFLG